MKIWLAGSWYTIDTHVLVVYLEDKDKRNIENMTPGCNLYCEYEEEIFSTEDIKTLLTRIKKEIKVKK